MLPIADRHLEYARRSLAELRDAGLRAELDDRAESVARKIRDGELRKIPYMLVVGDREAEAGTVCSASTDAATADPGRSTEF